ncbi:MAG: hypothetical protein GEV10_05435 [Streptosporangiales bacterium]|nr:hypothetical protein [Streptosporangiales bacterium]
MARRPTQTGYRTGALLLVLTFASCVLAGISTFSTGDAGVRTHGVVHVVKDTSKLFTGAMHRATADDVGWPVADRAVTLTLLALLLATAVWIAGASGRRRLRLAAVLSRGPPGRSALA